MSRKIKIFVAASASADDINSFLSALLVLVLEVNGNDTTSFRVDFKKWVAESSGILLQLGIKKEFTVVANKYQLKGEFTEPEAIVLGKLLKANRAKLERDNSISFEQLGLYNDCAGQMATNSMPAWRRIEKNVSMLRNPKLNQIFLPPEEQEDVGAETINVKSAVKAMQKYVVKLLGRTDKLCILPSEMKALREDPANIPVLKEYGVYAKAVRDVVKLEIRNYVRKSGNELLTVAEIQTYLTQKQLPNALPVGFTGGLIDESGHMYTKEGRRLERDLIGVVFMNPKYDPVADSSYVLLGKDVGRVKTLSMNANNKAERFGKVKTFFAKETQFRKSWLSDLKTVGSKEQIFAAMIEIMYQTSCRIGGKNNATKGEPTYGLTTLEVRHLAFLASSVEFNYAGKMAHEQLQVFKTTTADGKSVLAVLKKLVAGKSDTDMVFTFKGKPLTDSQTRVYLKTLGIEISPHYFRRLTGTKMAMGILKMCPFKKSESPKQSAVDKWVLEEFKRIGTVLHHNSGANVTGKTALKSYIDPLLMVEFYEGLGLRIPNFVPATGVKSAGETE